MVQPDNLRIIDGALTSPEGVITLPSVGGKGRFVEEFPLLRRSNLFFTLNDLQATFSLTVNDRAIFGPIDLRRARFQAF